MVARLLTLLALATVVFVPTAGSAPLVSKALAGPTGVHAFMLRADEPYQVNFTRTPSFAWTSLDGAQSYDFQLATSTRFDDRTLVWSSESVGTPLRVPEVSVPLSLPWMNGDQNAVRQHALYARVRARLASGVTRWSAALGFDTAGAAPNEILPDIPGLVRWTPVDGATSYEVWFLNVVVNGLRGKVVSTTTNVADEREYYTFHQDPSWSGTVIWRVRAVRQVYGALPNALPAVSYGPWSQQFVSVNPPVTNGTFIAVNQSVSDKLIDNTGALAHQLTPGYAFSGGPVVNANNDELYRVYVATDNQCVNVVFKGAIVGSPAYAPRTSGPLDLPKSPEDLLKARINFLPNGTEGDTFTADSKQVTTSELSDPSQTAAAASGSTPTSGTATSTIPAEFTSAGPFVDLWDLGRPNARYFWTSVPVRIVVTPDGKVEYEDETTAQDACKSGQVKEFARTSEPTTTTATKPILPFVSGISAFGQLFAARSVAPTFYRAPLVAWQPAKAAVGYEVQWSRTRSPWRTKGSTYTAATSTQLTQLTPGIWWYRVRGIDPYIPGPLKQMTWSTAVKITIAAPRFFDQSGVSTRRVKK